MCGSFNANLFVYGSNHSTEYQHSQFLKAVFFKIESSYDVDGVRFRFQDRKKVTGKKLF